MGTDQSTALKALHSLLQQLARAEAGLSEGPRRIALAEKQIKQTEQQIEQQKQAIRDAKKSADEQNLRLKTKEADILKLQGQLNTASSNKEYDIIRGQIKTATDTRGEIEEQGLLALEAVDTANATLKSLEADLTTRRKALQTAKSDFDRDKPALDAEIISLQQQISVAENLIPGSSRDNWKRLRGAHGPAALALIDGEFCVACSQKAIAQDLVRIRTGEIVFCRGCGRVLYQDL
jgi:predicted  nucleic acid-binding Zn-ribbon protein